MAPKNTHTHTQVSSPKYVNKMPTRFACPHAAHHQALTIDDMGVGFYFLFYFCSTTAKEKNKMS